MSSSLTSLGLLHKDALSGPACAAVPLGSLLYVSTCAFPHRVGAELPSVYNSSSKPALCNGVFLLAFHRILSSLHAYETTDSSTIYTVDTPSSGGRSTFRTDDGG